MPTAVARGEMLDARLRRDQLAPAARRGLAPGRRRRCAGRRPTGRVRIRRWPPSSGWSSMSTTLAPGRRRFERREAAGRPAADHDHVGVEVAAALRGGPGWPFGSTLPRPAACRSTRSYSGHRNARPDERLVVEADGQQAVEPVGERQQVDAAATARRSAAGPSCRRVTGRHAGPDVGLAVDVDQAVRAAAVGSTGCPRGRWYLKLCARTSTPSAASADAIVSPSRPRAGGRRT